MYLQTQGFVLKYRNWREGDRLYTIYTERVGKLEIQARGTRKPQSKLAGHLKPFQQINFNLAQGKRRFQLIGAQALQNVEWPETSGFELSNVKCVAYGYYMLELVDELTRVGQRSQGVFTLLREGLSALTNINQEPPFPPASPSLSFGGRGGSPLDKGGNEYKRLRVAFLLKLLKLTGFNPEIRAKRGKLTQETLTKYLTAPMMSLVKIEANGSLKSLFNISQFTLNEVIEKPLKSVKYLQSLQ